MLRTLRVHVGLALLAALSLAGSARAIIINSSGETLGSGTFNGIILLDGVQDFTLNGGNVLGDFTALNNTSATIAGGIIDGDLLVPGTNAVVEILGANFTVDGSASFPAVLTDTFCGIDGCHIVGTLQNGDHIDVLGYPVRSGTIRLVPEPASSVLLGVGLMGLAVAGRRPRRVPRR